MKQSRILLAAVCLVLVAGAGCNRKPDPNDPNLKVNAGRPSASGGTAPAAGTGTPARGGQVGAGQSE